MAVDLFPIVEKKENRIAICGFVNRYFAHSNPIRHLTVNIIPVTYKKDPSYPIVLLHKRCEHREIDPQKLDVSGGHVTLNDFLFQQLNWNGPSMIDQISQFTARREAREEIYSEPPAKFKNEHFHRFKDVAYFQCDKVDKEKMTYNFEYSTVYVVVLEPRESIWFQDFCPHCNTVSYAVCLPFKELIERFQADPCEFADGVTRILKKISEDSDMEHQLRVLMTTATPRA